MTLEEKAEEYAEKQNLQNVNPSGIVRCKLSRAYLAGAEEVKADCDFALEGKDVEIMELTEENEEMKKGFGCETCQIHLEYMRLNDKIMELEKENKDLQHRLDVAQGFLDRDKEYQEMCNQIEELKEQVEALANVNIKAQNIIGELKAQIEELKTSYEEEYWALDREGKKNAELETQIEKMKNECSTLLDKLYLSGLKEKQIALIEKMQDVLGV